MRQSQLIAKNMTVIVLSEIVGFGLHLAVTVLIARYLGTQGFGNYSFILAFVWVFQLIGDSGLSNIMVREISVKKESLEYQLGVTKSLIWVQSLIVFVSIALAASFLNLEASVRNSIYVMGLATLAMAHAVGYSSIFRAMEEMEYNAIGFVSHKAVLMIVTLIVIHFECGLFEITAVNLLSNVFLWFVYYSMIRYRYYYPKMIYDINAWRHLMCESIPVGISNVLRGFSGQVGILILTALTTAASVGLFSAPYKITQSLSILPQTLTIALFPYFSRLAKSSHHDLFDAYEKNLKFMYLLSVPIVVVFVILDQTVMSLLFGEKFNDARRAFQILSLNIVLLFQTSQFVYVFSSLGKQRLFTKCSIVGLIINIVVDIILIPRYDLVGACIGTLFAEMSICGIGMYFMKTMDGSISFIRASWKPLASGALMAVVLFPFRHASLTWALCGLVLSSLLYVLAIWILRTFSEVELSTIKEGISFLRKKCCTFPPSQGGEIG
jgi:O-antigen/teichoic acid export membrane protein